MKSTLKSIILAIGLNLIALVVSHPNSTFAAINCGDPNVVCKGGNLASNEVWTAGNVYIVTGSDLTIQAGVILTVQAGTVIKLDIGRSVNVDGSLVVNGAQGNPVFITSVRDDTLVGDTDHSTTAPAAGDWRRIYFRDNSSGTLSYVELRYGGSSYYSQGMLHTDAANVAVDHGVFKNSQDCAINSLASNEVTLTNMANTDFTGNRNNAMCIRSGSLNTNATWDETEVAYLIYGSLTVASGQTLTWAPGIVVKLWDGNTELFVDGTLNANGDSNNRIYVTSLHDDTLAGNTDNQTTTPAAGDWRRIYFRDNSSGTLAYVELRYGGSSYWTNGALHISQASPSVTNSRFYASKIAVLVTGVNSNPTITACQFVSSQNYGILNQTSGHWINATGNWWGANSGPYDPSSSGTDGDYNNTGSGDRVSDYVSYRPWVTIGFNLYLPLIKR